MDRLNQILESPSKLIVFSLDKEYKYLYFNQNHFETMKHIWGIEIELGKSMLDFIKSPLDRKKAKNNFDKALAGEDFSMVEEYGDEKLSRQYYEDIYTPLYDEKGKVQGLTVFVNDITERRTKEIELFEAEKRFRDIIESTFEGIIVARISDLKVIYINPAASKLFDYTEKDLDQLYVKDFHPEEEYEKIKSIFFSAPIEDKVSAEFIACKNKKGDLFYSKISASDILLNGEKCSVGYFTDVTSEIEFQKQIRFQQKILDAVGQAVLVTDLDNVILHWNKQAEKIYGWKKEEVLGKYKDEFLPSNMSKEEIDKVINHLQKGNHWTSEFEVKNKQGQLVPILLTSSPLFNDQKELTGIISISIDISDRKKSENLIRSNEKLYKSVISSLSEGLVVQDNTDKIILANESAAAILGLSMKQLLGKDSYDPHWKALKIDGSPLKPEEHPAMITLKTGRALDDQIMNVHTGNGHRKVISINTRPIKDDNGKITGAVASFTDITEKERAQNILRDNESRLKNISDSVPGAVLRYKLNSDQSDELLFISQGAEELWEFKKEEALKDMSKLWDPVHPDDVAGIKQSLLYSAANLQNWNHEWRITFKDKRIKWLNGRGFPVKSKDGSIIWDALILDITDQKNTLIKLDESQKLLESLNQNINEGIYRSNIEGVIYVNNAFLKMFGFDNLEELKNMSPESIYQNPKDRKNLLKKLEEQGYFENEEVVCAKKDGTTFIGLISSRIYKDYNGESFWDGAIRDVTLERKANKRIQESQQLLESINKNINEAIYRSVNRKGLVYVNEEFVKMFGYESAEELLSGDPVNLYKNSEDRRILGDELVEKGSYVNREVEFKRKDGSTFWGSISSIMLKGEDGQIYFDGAIRDISMQKEAEFALRKQANMQRLLRNISSNYINLPLDRVNEAINLSLEALGKFANADRAFVFDLFEDEKYCVNTFEWVNKGVSKQIDLMQFVPLEEIPELAELFLKGENVNIADVDELDESIFKSLLKEQEIKSTIGVPMMNNDKCIGFVGFDSVKNKKKFNENEIALLSIFSDMMLNIRNRTQKQIELKHLLNTTSDQNKRLKEFSFMTSHNIRSSVTNMIGLTNLILEEPDNRSYVELLQKTAEKLDTTIKNINQLLHFENSFQRKEMVDCNLKDTIDRILELNEKTIKEKGIKIKMNIPDDLYLYCIPAFLDSIFYNLLSNAFKYGVTRISKSIELKYKDAKEEAVIYVIDKGWGIDLEKYSEKLFKLGSRLHIGSEGQGLGLYMTKHQIEELGGSIDIKSKVDEGTTFIIKLPKSKSKILKGKESQTIS
ncbi:MAG: PAS domain S-box protein [Cytophagales bacterium]